MSLLLPAQLLCSLLRLLCLGAAPKRTQTGSSVIPEVGIVSVKIEGAAEGGERLSMASKFGKRDSSVTPGGGVFRIDIKRAVVGSWRFLGAVKSL